AVAVLVAKPFEDPFRGMPLLPRPTLILQQDLVDDPDKWVELRTCWRPAPPITGRYRKRQHLGYCPRINPKLTRRCPAAQPLNLNRITNPPIELHDLHPPTPADFGQRPSADGVLLRRNRTIRPPQSVRDFLSGASRKLGDVDIAAEKGPWYKDIGQGMGAALNTASASNAYVLSDRGTWLSFKNRGELRIVVEGDKKLFNQYG